MSNQPVIQAQGLCRRQGQRWVLLHLDFGLEAGESLLVAGGNGAGKSTLLRLLSTLTPPSQGDLALFGRSVRQTRRPQRARIGLLGHANQLYHDLGTNDSEVGDFESPAPAVQPELWQEKISEYIGEEE